MSNNAATILAPAAPTTGGAPGTIAFNAPIVGDDAAARASERNQAFIDELLAGNISFTAGQPLAAGINTRIAELDLLLSAMVSDVLHHPDFQKLEASWRGLNQLVMNSDTGPLLKLRVLSATTDELRDDLNKAIDFDQSALFKKLYEEEYGTFGGNPYSCLLFDYEFDRSPMDADLAARLSGVAAAAHAPMIAAASPRLFDPGWTDFQRLPIPRDLSKIFEAIDLAPWNAFRKSEDSRYLSLVMPRVMMRLPYGAKTSPVEGMDFEETVDGATHTQFLWGTGAWALGQRITAAFSLYGWCAAIRGMGDGGGMVDGLPLYTFTTPAGDTTAKIPTEVSITDRREKELNDLGFIALCYQKGTNSACFFGGATTQKPVTYTNPAASENAQASALLPYVLAASRFAHYIKQIGRQKVGTFQTRAGIEKALNSWIADYVLLNDDAPQQAKARYPLREARIDVTEVPGQLGAYNATVFLRPHFQLEALTASIRLVAKIPPPAAAGA
ncbi:MAG TPA: type VI secretion system contractile sheath large subunit, partial [Longimicrobium sp.]|jgi:type VI secretion system protein ImpC|uniref:type VI secretion system contractile sheath large subunit n=1 Tax=Longimicrobium sp. TaxID=2029185 RepID=UPI002ED9D32C